MPTAHQYRTIAARLRRVLDSVDTLLRPVAAAADAAVFGGTGGRLERTVDTTLAVTAANVATIVAELHRQIAEAERRAVVCERYAAAVGEYRRLDDHAKRFPRRPAGWADHG